MGNGEGWGEGLGEGSGAAHWKHGILSWDRGLCCYANCCLPCQNHKNAENLGQNGMVHALLSCVFPTLPAFWQVRIIFFTQKRTYNEFYHIKTIVI